MERFLLEVARKMEKEAIGKMFDLYAYPLYNYALRRCGDPMLADHIVGDVFARLLEQCAIGKGQTSNLRSYLYETAYHLRETAAIVGKDVHHVKVIQSRALAKLRKVLEPSQLRKAVSLTGVRKLSKALRV